MPLVCVRFRKVKMAWSMCPTICLVSLVLIRYAFAHPLSSVGSIGVLNHCDAPIYLKVTREADCPTSILEPGGTYRETYQFPAHGGTSVKLAKDTDSLQNGENEVQLEYTCTDQCYVDFSLINDATKFPGENTTLSLRPSDPRCDTLICTAGDTTCRNAYYIPTDDHAVRACSLEASWTFTLCDRPSTR